MEPTSIVSTKVDAPARLSFAQKRDLLGHAVAAVLTTALIAAPLVTPSLRIDREERLAPLPAASFAGPVVAVPLDHATPAGKRSAATGVPVRRAIGDTTPLEFVSAAVPVEAVGTSGVTRRPPAAPQDAPRRPLPRRLAGRLTGWLTGDGTPGVRPFPSVGPVRP